METSSDGHPVPTKNVESGGIAAQAAFHAAIG